MPWKTDCTSWCVTETLTLAEAQQAIRTDWIDAYERFISH
jgi:hypothetical protein